MRKFLKTMDSQGAYLAPALAANLNLKNRRSLLDIAGGSGVYACHIVQKHPHIKATVVEKRPVDTVALEHISNRECLGSVSVTEGDIFSESLAEGYDVHLWSNVLHDWDTSTVNLSDEKSHLTRCQREA